MCDSIHVDDDTQCNSIAIGQTVQRDIILVYIITQVSSYLNSRLFFFDQNDGFYDVIFFSL